MVCAKMLKENQTEETIGFLSHFYHWWHFIWEGPCPELPQATPMINGEHVMTSSPGRQPHFFDYIIIFRSTKMLAHITDLSLCTL